MDYRQGREEHAHGQGVDHFFESSYPHFFKIILHDTIQSGKLGIPKKFARKYCGSDLDFSGKQHHMVSLKVPSGDAWDVEMKKCDDDNNQLCLQRGWPEFVDFYGIKHGHFLVFKHKRNDMFHVRIFDTSTMEIRYLIRSSKNTNKGQENIHLVEDRFRGSPVQVEVVRTSSTDNTTIEIEDTTYVEAEVGTDSDTSTYKWHPRRAKKERLLERASYFKSSMKNSYFSILMRPSHVNYRMLELPVGFFVECLALRRKTIVELCTSARRSWMVKYYFNVYNNNRRTCRLTSGWREFVKDNKLVEGDVCVFELIKRSPIVFHVTISRAPQDPTFACGSRGGFKHSKPKKSMRFPPNSHKLRDDGVLRTTYNTPLGQVEKDISAQLLRGSSFNPTNPSFSIVMQPSCVRNGILNLPRSVFVRQLGLNSDRIVNLCTSDGRSWTAKYKCTVSHNRAYSRLLSGWREFVKDNNLEEGDVCIFKLINFDSTSIVFQVTICKDVANLKKCKETGTCHTGKRKREDEILCSRPWKKLDPCPASARSSTSKFQTVITQHSLCSSNVSIPIIAARRIFMLSEETKKNMKLEVGDKRWSVKALYYPKYKSGKISAGWTNFVKENFLKVGDICSFELVDSRELVMKVSIQSANMKNAKEEMPS